MWKKKKINQSWKTKERKSQCFQAANLKALSKHAAYICFFKSKSSVCFDSELLELDMACAVNANSTLQLP